MIILMINPPTLVRRVLSNPGPAYAPSFLHRNASKGFLCGQDLSVHKSPAKLRFSIRLPAMCAMGAGRTKLLTQKRQ